MALNAAAISITRTGFGESEGLGDILASSAFTLPDVASSTSYFVPAYAKVCRTQSYSLANFGVGGAIYKRVDAQPSHQLRFRTADRYLSNGTVSSSNGGWWQICETLLYPEMAGASGNGTADDQSAITNTIAAANSLSRKAVYFRPVSYGLGSRVTLVSGVRLIGVEGATTFKVLASNSATNGKTVGASNTTDLWVRGVVFDGALAADTTPLTQIFNCQDVHFEHCWYVNSSGIAANLSTTIQGICITDCKFDSIGYSTGIGGSAAKQAIAFSSGGHTDVYIERNRFEDVGLDCISLDNITRGRIVGNTSVNCYTLIFNNKGLYSKYLTITGNTANAVVNDAGAPGSRPQPNGIDLPWLADSLVSNNIAYECAAAGIGIFEASKNVRVSGNTVARNGQAASSAYDCGVVVKAPEDGTAPTGIVVEDNDIYDDQGSPTQNYGVIISTLADVRLGRGNRISGAVTAEAAIVQYLNDTDSGTLVRSFTHDYGPGLHAGYRTDSRWYNAPGTVFATTPAAQSADTIYFMPLVVERPLTISALGIRIHSGVASSAALLGIYANNKSSVPGVRLAKISAEVDGSSAAAVSNNLDANISLKPGETYWLAMLCKGAISAKTLATTASSFGSLGSTTLADVTNGVTVTGYSASSTYTNGMPSDASGLTLSGIITAVAPVVAFKSV